LYFIKRLSLAVFTLLLISICLFGLSKCTPVHPVEALFDQEQTSTAAGLSRAPEFSQQAALLGLDRPAFYCTIQSRAYPDTLYKVFPPDYQAQLVTLIDQTGSAEVAEQWLLAVHQARLAADTLTDLQQREAWKTTLAELSNTNQVTDLQAIMSHQVQNQSDPLATQKAALQDRFAQVTTATAQSSAWQRMPHFLWHGTNNQYHKWLTAMLHGDAGRSYTHQRPVSQILHMKLKWSIMIGMLSLIIAFGVAIPCAVWTAGRSRKPIQQSRLNRLALFIYASPVIWIGSMSALLFASPWAGMDIFKFGCNSSGQSSIFALLAENASCIVLPVLCMAIHIGAVVYLQMRNAMTEVLQRDFVRTARMKGLSERKVIWRHAFPNALFPIITMLGGILAFVVAGSVVIEYLFILPGMGSAMVESFAGRDYPVLFAIMILYAVAIILGNLIADLCYAWLDPRVRF
jgi:peptide/nickel transport system permease protein